MKKIDLTNGMFIPVLRRSEMKMRPLALSDSRTMSWDDANLYCPNRGCPNSSCD